jgi:hypothetical protein
MRLSGHLVQLLVHELELGLEARQLLLAGGVQRPVLQQLAIPAETKIVWSAIMKRLSLKKWPNALDHASIARQVGSTKMFSLIK